MKRQDVFMVFSKRILKSLHVFRHSVGKVHKTCATQLVRSMVFESFYCKIVIVKKNFMKFDPPFFVSYSANLLLLRVATFFLTKFDPGIFVS